MYISLFEQQKKKLFAKRRKSKEDTRYTSCPWLPDTCPGDMAVRMRTPGDGHTTALV